MAAADVIQQPQPSLAPPAGRGAPAARADDPAAALRRLVGDAAGLDLDDTVAVTHVRAHGHRVTARLVAAGVLPPHLLVELDDPPVVALRTLALAARRQRRR